MRQGFEFKIRNKSRAWKSPQDKQYLFWIDLFRKNAGIGTVLSHKRDTPEPPSN